MKNRDAAIRSRQKKKQESETVQFKLDRSVKECTRLKLDNAALRAENQILKRQLHYFEDLFAKKTTSVTLDTHNSSLSAKSPTAPSTTTLSTTHRSQGHSPTQSNTSCSLKDQEAQDDTSEVSFVLERAQPAAHGSMFGAFTIALIMCVCCIGSLSYLPDS